MARINMTNNSQSDLGPLSMSPGDCSLKKKKKAYGRPWAPLPLSHPQLNAFAWRLLGPGLPKIK